MVLIGFEFSHIGCRADVLKWEWVPFPRALNYKGTQITRVRVEGLLFLHHRWG